jgi:hypothetical protein
MDRITCRLEGVKITWKGQRSDKSGKTRDVVQGIMAGETGYVTPVDFGGSVDAIRGLEVGETVTIDVSVRSYQDRLFVDIIGVARGVHQVGKSALKAVNV